MEYLDSTHFSDKISYKILFISSYGSKDMNLPRFAYLQDFSEKKNRNLGWTRARLATDKSCRTPAMDNTGRKRAGAQLDSDLNKNEEKRVVLLA
jgi:hypothetical protein